MAIRTNKSVSLFFFIVLVFTSFTFIQPAFVEIVSADELTNTSKWRVPINDTYEFWSTLPPLSVDINGDGFHYIFYSGRNGDTGPRIVSCFNGSNGENIWTKDISSMQTSVNIPMAIADLNNDGTIEIVIAAGYRTLALNCEDGSEFWNVSTISGWGHIAIADVDGTGYPYVYTSSNTAFGESATIRKLNGSTGEVIKSNNVVTYTCYGGISIADLNQDGDYEIVLSDSGDSLCFDTDLNLLWTTTESFTSESHCAILEDVTDDENLEVIILKQTSPGEETGGVYIYSSNGTTIRGTSNLGLAAHEAPAVFSFNDESNKLLVTSYGTYAKIWDLVDWQLYGTLDHRTMGRPPSTIVDLTGDGNREILAHDSWAYTRIYNSSLDVIESTSGWYAGETIVQDIDGDGYYEIIGTYDNYIWAEDTNTICPEPAPRTDCHFYSERRTKVAEYVAPIGAKCVLSEESPSDNSEDIPTTTSLISVDIDELDNDPIYWTIETSPNIGNSSGTMENDGVKTCNISGLNYDATYTWWVNASDGTNFISEEYRFDTESNVTPSQNDFYVCGTTGSDENNGDFSNPWATIEYAATQVTNGDTVHIKAGSYTPVENIIIDNMKSDGWVTFKNYNDDLVIIDGANCPSTSSWYGTITIKRSDRVRITGLHINGSASSGIVIWNKIGGVSNPCSFIRVDNCTINHSAASAIIAEGFNITFEDNYLYKNFNNWSGISSSQEVVSFQNVTNFSISNNRLINNHVETIDLKGGTNTGFISYNFINNTNPEGLDKVLGIIYYGGPAIMIDARGISHNVSIFNNYITGNNSGISLNTESTGHYEHIQIYNNVVNINKLGNPSGINSPQPIILTNTGNSNDVFHNISIYSNTVHNGDANDYAVFQIGHYTLNRLNANNLKDVKLYNNIFSTEYIGTGSFIAAHHLLPTDIAMANNNYYHYESSTYRNRWDQTFYTNQTEWNFGAGAIFDNPKYLEKENKNFSIQSDSPCIDTASEVIVSNVDFNKISRPQGSGYDIGAFEYISSYDYDSPHISDVLITTSDPLDTNMVFGWQNISCIVTDEFEVDQVILNIVGQDNTEDNFEMIKSSSSDFYYFNTSLSNYGNYSYNIYADDINDNYNYSDTFLFSLPPNWDMNCDGECNILDLSLVSNRYGDTNYPGWDRSDVDNNGIINMLDMIIVSEHIGDIWYI